MKPIILHQYQQDLKAKIYNSWNQGNRNVLAVLPTGGGKSIVVSDIVNDLHRAGRKTIVLAHRNELVTQMSGHIAARGIPHRIIGANTTVSEAVSIHREKFNQSFVNPTAPIAVVGVDTLIARREELQSWASQIHNWIQDECFPAGTQIEVNGGTKSIEDVVIGDEVLAFNEITKKVEIKKVTELFKNPMKDSMVRLTSVGHHAVVCTGNHPIYTDRGWVEASKITTEDYIYVLQQRSLHGLPKACCDNSMVSEKQISQDREGLLFRNLRENLLISDFISDSSEYQQKVCFCEDDYKKSNDEPKNAGKGFENFEGDKTQAKGSRRKRKVFTSSGIISDSNVGTIGIHCSISDKNKPKEGREPSSMLQTRHGSSNSETGDRSGWVKSQFIGQESARPEERYVFDRIRVESVEILKRADFEQSYGSYTYNFAVDDLHTYVANGIAVHNCHHGIGNDRVEPNKWGKATQMFHNASGLGVTATPQRADGQGLGRSFDGFYDDMVLGPSMRWLIQNDFLCDYEIVCPRSDIVDSIENEKVSADGDWSHQTMRKAAKKSKIVGDVVENYVRYAMGRRAIVFATDIETASEMAEQFNQRGIRAVSLNGKSNPAYRRQSLRQFASGEVQVLINVDLFDEGFDCLDTETEVLTPNGWKNYKDISNETQCYAWDKDTGIITTVPIQHYGIRDLKDDEKMLTIESQHLDIRVTEGHRIFYKDVNYYKYDKGLSPETKVRYADEIFKDARNKFALPLCGKAEFNGVQLSDDEIRILGWYMTDGYLEKGGSLSIYQCKSNFINDIRDILTRLNWDFRERIRIMKNTYGQDKEMTIFSIKKSTISKLYPYMDKKNPPKILNNMTREQFKILWDSMMDGNGSRHNGSDTFCVTRYKGQADFILAAASVRGFATMYGTYLTKNNVMMYNMRIRDEKWMRLYQKDKRGARFSLELSKEKEQVWCITNKLGTLITRRNGKVVILGNCPACDVCIMARPTASLTKYMQMVGRALRFREDKTALIIDHVSNVIRHGLPDKVRKWSLGRKDKRAKQLKDPNEIELTTCKACTRPYEKFRTVCPYCQFEKPLPEPRSRSIEMVEGDLVLLDREALEKMRQATELESAGSVAARVAHAAGPIAGKGAANRQMEKIAAHAGLSEAIAQWAAIERNMGFDDRQIAKKFYLTTGVDVLSALDGKRDRKEFDEMTSMVKGWYEVNL